MLSISHLVQPIIVGAVLAFITAILVMNAVERSITTTVNGWKSTMRAGQPGNGILVRAACAKALPAVNVVEEAAYWTTTVDGSGHKLTGQRKYVMRFPAGQLPPNDAFWSLTITDTVGYMVQNPVDRYSVGSTTGLVANPDGSTDIYIQPAAPAGHEANWLPAPPGSFKLWLRAYMPGRAILDSRYRLPPVVPTGNDGAPA